jgi:hypothetical protein
MYSLSNWQVVMVLSLDQRDVPLSRNNWLLEAAIEKLRKNGTGGSHGAQ